MILQLVMQRHDQHFTGVSTLSCRGSAIVLDDGEGDAGGDWCYSFNCFWCGYWWKYTDGTATIDDGAVTGVTTITGSGLATVGALDVDDVLVDGATIGHTDDTNLNYFHCNERR